MFSVSVEGGTVVPPMYQTVERWTDGISPDRVVLPPMYQTVERWTDGISPGLRRLLVPAIRIIYLDADDDAELAGRDYYRTLTSASRLPENRKIHFVKME
jgi:hypothetical protein